MNRIPAAALAALLLFALATSGCYSAPIMPPNGVVYTDIEAPLSPVAFGRSIGARKGEASSQSILGLVAWGDASVEAAARDGLITEPKHIDYGYFNVLGVYQSFTTIVRGD
ncbi:MAG TPA: TRL-like family protein, partial [Myxococcota bacterium]|nr:TRL-like family protein [Myxococcota bacterium]